MEHLSGSMVLLRPKEQLEELQAKIRELKKRLNAVILSHNYQRGEVQDIADFVGDSLDLSRKAAQVKADVIVFCGVLFMAETAQILNPTRTVLLADRMAGCPMANMIDVDDLSEWKQKHPDATVVCYVNSSAAVKSESYICCTSANALNVVESVPSGKVLFIPDKNLGQFVARKTKKEMILYPGFCPTHARLLPDQVKLARKMHPDSPVIVHPECIPEVIDLADAVLSTSQMAKYVQTSPASSFLVGTEEGLLYRLRNENPGKVFYLISTSLVCPNMKRTTLETVLKTMEHRDNAVTVPERIRLRAKEALNRMLEVR